MRQKYADWTPIPSTRAIIDTAEDLAEELVSVGIKPTARQLYYALVRRGSIPNTPSFAKLVERSIPRARVAGLLDWDLVQEDSPAPTNRTASLDSLLLHYGLTAELDIWRGQAYRPEVWVEKDSLVPFVTAALAEYQVPVRSLRANAPSVGLLRAVALDHADTERAGQHPYVIYLGDHDPFGLTIEESFRTRLAEFGSTAPVVRLAADYMEAMMSGKDIPSMPEPQTDQAYIEAFGAEYAFEPEAYDPQELQSAIRSEVEALADSDSLLRAIDWQSTQRARLINLSADDLLQDVTRFPNEAVGKLGDALLSTADTTRAKSLKLQVEALLRSAL